MADFTAEEIAERRNWIGGSEAATAVGVNKYEAQFHLWQKKLGLAEEFVGNEFTLWGKLHEPVIRQQYAERMQQVVRLPEATIVHPKYPWMACHPDGVTDSKRLLEVKTAGFAIGWGEPGTDEIPEPYMIQVQHNMLVMGLEVADVAALINGNDLRFYEIPANPQLQQLIVDAEASFWNFVVTQTVPPPDFNRADAVEVLRAMYPGTTGEILHADAATIQIRTEIERYTQAEKDAKAAKDGYRARMLDAMKDATFMEFPDGKKYRRSKVSRKGYSVEPTTFMDLRLVNS